MPQNFNTFFVIVDCLKYTLYRFIISNQVCRTRSQFAVQYGLNTGTIFKMIITCIQAVTF